MARRCKSNKQPEQGYQHRDHRSSGGRGKNMKYKKKIRNRLRIEKEKLVDE